MVKTSQVAKTPDQCPRFLNCNAQLCPLDKGLAFRMWYPDEAICGKQGMFQKHHWIRIQRRIQRKVKDREKYFTVEMLKRIYMVGVGTRGLNPDASEEHLSKEWLSRPIRKKKEKPIYSEEELKILRERMKKARAVRVKNLTSTNG